MPVIVTRQPKEQLLAAKSAGKHLTNARVIEVCLALELG